MTTFTTSTRDTLADFGVQHHAPEVFSKAVFFLDAADKAYAVGDDLHIALAEFFDTFADRLMTPDGGYDPLVGLSELRQRSAEWIERNFAVELRMAEAVLAAE